MIGHDSEASDDVGICNDAGCFKKDIYYFAGDKQIEALIELSNECHQYFKVLYILTNSIRIFIYILLYDILCIINLISNKIV